MGMTYDVAIATGEKLAEELKSLIRQHCYKPDMSFSNGGATTFIWNGIIWDDDLEPVKAIKSLLKRYEDSEDTEYAYKCISVSEECNICVDSNEYCNDSLDLHPQISFSLPAGSKSIEF